MKKLVKCFTLMCLCTMCFGMTAFAAEVDEVNTDETNSKRVHDTEIKRVFIDDGKKEIEVIPSGQPTEGYWSESGAPVSVHFTDEGGGVDDVTVEVGVKSVGVSISLGKESRMGAFEAIIPNDGYRYQVYLIKEVFVEEYDVYERLAGSNNPWTYVTTHYDVEETGIGIGTRRLGPV